jgi:magnesium transporter
MPGALGFAERTMIRVTILRDDAARLERGGEELLGDWSARSGPGGDAVLWLDVEGEPAERERELLCGRFELHPNGVTDALRERHPPKVEQFADHLLLLLRGLDPRSTRDDLCTVQLALFIGRNFLITRHPTASVSVDGFWGDIESERGRIEPLVLALRITRRMTDAYLDLLFELEDRLEEIEEEILRRPDDRLLTELSGYTRELTRLRRNFVYHNQAFARMRMLLQSEFEQSDLIHDFNDVAEQVERVGSLADLYYQLANDLIQTYVSLASHRLNGIMKVLTIVTAIFVPLSFLAGIYGMNFEYMPELGERNAYFMLLGVMASIVVLLLTIFRRKRWL